MPPRKSDVSKSTTDEAAPTGTGTPAKDGASKEKETKEPKEAKDGINIEVRHLQRYFYVKLIMIGSQSPEIYSDPTCERRPPPKHTDPSKRNTGPAEERDSLYQLSGFTVCSLYWKAARMQLTWQCECTYTRIT